MILENFGGELRGVCGRYDHEMIMWGCLRGEE